MPVIHERVTRLLSSRMLSLFVYLGSVGPISAKDGHRVEQQRKNQRELAKTLIEDEDHRSFGREGRASALGGPSANSGERPPVRTTP